LDVNTLNISFKVVGEMPVGAKLCVINKSYLSSKSGYMDGFVRYKTGQGRKLIISFLEHMMKETKRNAYQILNNIKKGVDIDNNINILSGMMHKLSNFLHKFEHVRQVYKDDSSCYARFGNIRDNFFNFTNIFYRDMILQK